MFSVSHNTSVHIYILFITKYEYAYETVKMFSELGGTVKIASKPLI